MRSEPVRAAGKAGETCLSLLPEEIISEIFCLLPSFTDIFNLASSCTRLKRMWKSSVTLIYHSVAQRRIPCLRQARCFLTDQGGPSVDSPTITTENVSQMVRNAHTIEKAILQFEKEIVCRVEGKAYSLIQNRPRNSDQQAACGHSAKKYYGEGARRHPKTLTSTERPRFIRSYYQLWSMMTIDAEEWQPRLDTMSLKQLYYLCEMSKLTQSIGREEIVPAPQFPNADPDLAIAINSGRSKKRIALDERIWGHITRVYQRVYHREAEWPWIFTKEEGYLWFIVIWDHWQPSLKSIVCSSRQSFEQMHLWDDTSDDDI